MYIYVAILLQNVRAFPPWELDPTPQTSNTIRSPRVGKYYEGELKWRIRIKFGEKPI